MPGGLAVLLDGIGWERGEAAEGWMGWGGGGGGGNADVDDVREGFDARVLFRSFLIFS